jgi:tetratricopeptide (TPR) repeat protein
MKVSLSLVTILLVSCCPIGTLQARSLQTDPLTRFLERPAPPVSPEAAKKMEAQLADARAAYKANPNDPDRIIWLGRRLAYPGRFKEAIDVFSEGIRKFPNDPRFYRHRGHRYITLRRLDLAIKDLRRAASLVKGTPDEIEPDGQPNARNIPTSTLQFNIWYHLGLAYYLTGDYEKALASYRECLKVSKNPDALVATTHWQYMTLRRLNRTREANRLLNAVGSGLEIIENDGYYQLLLMYKGLVGPKWLLEQVSKQPAGAGAHSVLYGIGSWYLDNGQRDEAMAVFKTILGTDQWTSFGFIAAEADLERLQLKPRTI